MSMDSERLRQANCPFFGCETAFTPANLADHLISHHANRLAGVPKNGEPHVEGSTSRMT